MTKIIVADDSYAQRKTIVRLIKTIMDAEIIEANNGVDVIMQDLTDVDMIISDIIMPIMDGMKLTQHIRRVKQADIPIIILSSDLSERDVKKGRQLGVTAFMQKPVDKNKIEDILHTYL